MTYPRHLHRVLANRAADFLKGYGMGQFFSGSYEAYMMERIAAAMSGNDPEEQVVNLLEAFWGLLRDVDLDKTADLVAKYSELLTEKV